MGEDGATSRRYHHHKKAAVEDVANLVIGGRLIKSVRDLDDVDRVILARAGWRVKNGELVRMEAEES